MKQRPEAFRAVHRTGIYKGERVVLSCQIQDDAFITTEKGRCYKLVGQRWQRQYRSVWERVLGWFGR